MLGLPLCKVYIYIYKKIIGLTAIYNYVCSGHNLKCLYIWLLNYCSTYRSYLP